MFTKLLNGWTRISSNCQAVECSSPPNFVIDIVRTPCRHYGHNVVNVVACTRGRFNTKLPLIFSIKFELQYLNASICKMV